MNWQGAVIGAMAFILIGAFHPVVIRTEYYFGKRVWPVFLVAGVALIILSIFIHQTVLSAAIGVAGFSCLWSIHELVEQENRVRKGWFPENPAKKKPKDI